MTRKQLSATEARNLRTLLLLNVFEPEEIGVRIAQAREKAGLTQEELGDIIDMSTRQVQNYEAGDSKPYKKIKEIAAATGVTVEWLLGTEPSEQAAEAGADLAERLDRLAQAQERHEALLRELLQEIRGEEAPPRARPAN